MGWVSASTAHCRRCRMWIIKMRRRLKMMLMFIRILLGS
ncbi:hypothetical protein MTR67_014198 [Solanum verrucosum]|uniref:Uncharacterized protein n=1 Tax=Solanum verrucosum TaxID=315347 RepID=A0AAF0TMS0_SOLVR|nr:hypothetical protein MTR67_014198 [Solanum verrucosum]